MRLTDRRLGHERRVSRADDRRRRQLADRDVVGMAIRPLGPEGDDDVRLDPAEVSRDLRARFHGVDLVERPVLVIEERNFPQAKLDRGRAQLRLSGLADDGRARRLGAVAVPATLTSRRRDEIRTHAFCRTLRQCSTGTERLVVWMRQDAHQPKFRSGHTSVLSYQLSVISSQLTVLTVHACSRIRKPGCERVSRVIQLQITGTSLHIVLRSSRLRLEVQVGRSSAALVACDSRVECSSGPARTDRRFTLAVNRVAHSGLAWTGELGTGNWKLGTSRES